MSANNWYTCLKEPVPGFDVLLSLLDAKLHVADVRAEPAAPPPPIIFAVKCSVLHRVDHAQNIHKEESQ